MFYTPLFWCFILHQPDPRPSRALDPSSLGMDLNTAIIDWSVPNGQLTMDPIPQVGVYGDSIMQPDGYLHPSAITYSAAPPQADLHAGAIPESGNSNGRERSITGPTFESLRKVIEHHHAHMKLKELQKLISTKYKFTAR